MIEDTAFLDSQDTELVYSRSVVEFVAVANEYCKFIEFTGQMSKKEFVEKSQKLLAFVYLKASTLPAFETEFEGAVEKFVAEQDWEYVKSLVENKLVSHDAFVEISDPLYPDSDNTTSVSISECLADIYQDLKDFITAYDIGTHDIMLDSLWECKQNFQNYWGERLLAVLSQFHSLAFGVVDLSDENTPLSSEREASEKRNWFTEEILSPHDDDNDE